MRRWMTSLALLASVVCAEMAMADGPPITCKLDLKRSEQPSGFFGRASPGDWTAMCRPQSIYMELGSRGAQAANPAFKKAVTKEPEKYVDKKPFRGVVTLGGKPYGYVLDKSDEKAKTFDRLYFDAKGAGDLTAAPPLEAKPVDAKNVPEGLDKSGLAQFPRIDLTLDVKGQKVETSIFFQVFVQKYDNFSYGNCMVTTAAYREGKATIDGKPCRIVVLDANSNGLFNEPTTVRKYGDNMYANRGDVIVIDDGKRTPAEAASDSESDGQSKMIAVGKRFYELEVSPNGAEVKLTPSSTPVGFATHAASGFKAVVVNDGDVALNVAGGKEPTALPAGNWKLASYTLTVAARKDAKTDVGATSPGCATPTGPGGPGTIISATGTAKTPALEVKAGETTAIKWGEPLKATVTATVVGDKKSFATVLADAAKKAAAGKTKPAAKEKKAESAQARQITMSLSLVGAQNERITSLLVNGNRPPAPKFEVLNAKGEVVHTGNFEYG